MKIPSRGGFVVLAMCAIAAASASPAAAAAAEQQGTPSGRGPDRTNGVPDVSHATAQRKVPVVVPLKPMERVLPVDAPKVGGSVPVTPVEQTQMPRTERGQVLPRPLVPSVETTGDTPSASVEAPLPGITKNRRRDAVQVSAPAFPLKALGPTADRDQPLKASHDDGLGLPEVDVPKASVGSSAMQGTPGAHVGVAPQDQPSRLPLADVVGGAPGMLQSGKRALVG